MAKKAQSDPLAVPIRILQPLVDAIGEFFDLWLKFVDLDGEYILTPDTKQPCRFCQLVRSTPAGRERCKASARQAIVECSADMSARYSHCHAQARRITVPIAVEGKCIGALVCGEIVAEKPTEKQLETVSCLAREIGVDSNELLRAFCELPVWNHERLRVTGEILDALSNCFVKVAIAVSARERAEAEKFRREAELKALQARINPHFLFNALNTVAMLALIENAPQTRQVTQMLARLLKLTFRPKDPLIPLAQELELVDSYLSIQKVRFGDRLHIAKEVPEHLLRALILPLSLQPLVENALVHGIEPLESGGTIWIGGCLDKSGRVCLSVRDNGVGMGREKVLAIRRAMKRSLNGASSGLLNVYHRYRLMFDQQGDLTLQSSPGNGTEVRLFLPYIDSMGEMKGCSLEH